MHAPAAHDPEEFDVALRLVQWTGPNSAYAGPN